MEVPLLDLRAQFVTIEDEIRTAIDRVLVAQRFILGPEVSRLEQAVAAYCGCPYGIGVSSGTDALLCTLMAMDIGPGDEVIVPAFSFFATVGCVVRLRAKPVFVDIESDTFNIVPEKVIEAITPRTRAIIVVHLFGQCVEMGPIREAAQARGIKIIEDAAQAIGATHHGQRSGALGDVGCFSFFPSKNLGGCGDGGMIVTGDADLAERCRLLRMHGAAQKYHHTLVGGNFRLDALQAAILNVKMGHLDAWNAGRRAAARRWHTLLAETAVQTPLTRPENEHVFHQYVVRTPQRDALRRALADQGIATGVYYPKPLHLLDCFADLGGRAGDCPVAEAACSEVLALPIYPELPAPVQGYVAEAVRGFFVPQPVGDPSSS